MRIFITGGVGFIGCNVAAHYLSQGNHVTIFDNLSRLGTHYNLKWLQKQPSQPGALCIIQDDIRNREILSKAISDSEPDLIMHFAAQVAVTTSLKQPREDFEVNALGTFNVLEAARSLTNPPAIFYTSTNKVYGGLEDVQLIEENTRYNFKEFPLGIDETRQLDFHSPYGCSKGAGDQYVRDYSRIYGLKTVVFRQSSIYGERQLGTEDQAWLAYFIVATVLNRPITIYGNGKQVRDMLHIKDLIRLYDMAWNQLDLAKGEIFNVGGGVLNSMSIWSECGPILEGLAGHAIQVERRGSRPGDQLIFIANTTKAKQLLGWEPTISLNVGIQELWDWVNANYELFQKVFSEA